ncbi:MAG: DUF3592 domain-containing protein [Planctomycetia bacterium]|nr:DUF3592 domain-containing protein [Planctomycetia bacterium]
MDDTLKPEELFGDPQPKKVSQPEGMRMLSPSPRGVSPGAMGTLLLTQNTGCFAWLFFLFGAMATLVVFTLACNNVTEWIPSFIVPWETLPDYGTVVTCEEMNLRVNDSPVFRLTFEYTDGDRKIVRTYKTLCSWQDGEQILLERRWGYVRPVMTGALVGAWVLLLVGIFPLVGLGMVVGQFRSGWRAVRLLKYGDAAVGIPCGAEETGVRYNQRPEYRVKYMFQTASGENRAAFVRTYDIDRFSTTESDTILYDPNHPGGAVSLEDLQKDLYVTSAGDIAMRWKCCVSLALWFLAVAGLLVAAYYLFMN